MKWLKFGNDIINAEMICAVRILWGQNYDREGTMGSPDPYISGATIIFQGGGEIKIEDDKAMEAFVTWLASEGQPLKTIV